MFVLKKLRRQEKEREGTKAFINNNWMLASAKCREAGDLRVAGWVRLAFTSHSMSIKFRPGT